MNAPFGFKGRRVGRAVPAVAEVRFVSKGFLPDDLWPDTLTTEVGQGTVGVDVPQGQGIAVIASIAEENAGPVVVRGGRVVVAGGGHVAARDFGIVANTIPVNIRRAVAVADPQSVHRTHTGVDVVTDAIAIGIGRAVATADTDGVFFTHTGVDIVANAIAVRIRGTGAAAHTNSIELVAVAVAVPGGNAISSADAALVELGSVAIAIPFRNGGAPTIIDRARSTAHATSIQLRAGSIVFRGGGVVVARGIVRTSEDGGVLHAEIGDVRGQEFPSRGHHSALHIQAVASASPLAANAVSIAVVDGEGVATRTQLFGDGEVAVVGIRTTRHDGGPSGVHQSPRGFTAILVRVDRHRERLQTAANTGSIVNGRAGVVVAGIGRRTTVTAEVAGSVVVDGCRIKVAGRVVRASAVDLTRGGASVGGQQALPESAGLEQGEHPVGLALGEQVHATIVGIVHVVLDHVGGVAADGAQRTSVVRSIGSRGVRYKVVHIAVAIAPDVAQVQPVADLVGRGPAQIERRCGRANRTRVLVAVHHAVGGG